MHKQDIDKILSLSTDMPLAVRRLQSLVLELGCTTISEQDKMLIYDLLDVINQLGERVRGLEWRYAGNHAKEVWEAASREWEAGTWRRHDDQEAGPDNNSTEGDKEKGNKGS